jgi:hypothetical protein
MRKNLSDKKKAEFFPYMCNPVPNSSKKKAQMFF